MDLDILTKVTETAVFVCCMLMLVVMSSPDDVPFYFKAITIVPLLISFAVILVGVPLLIWS